MKEIEVFREYILLNLIEIMFVSIAGIYSQIIYLYLNGHSVYQILSIYCIFSESMEYLEKYRNRFCTAEKNIIEEKNETKKFTVDMSNVSIGPDLIDLNISRSYSTNSNNSAKNGDPSYSAESTFSGKK